ncbi:MULTISPECIES: hypothetical protein [Rhodopirellula]|uniref:hypothetical protein n=1 Tax=Rhodopirellula TaxID=265488 RepID=UPI002579DFCE|nr:hypothetical protein [Rhodopirellula sp. UBA1907]
MTTQYQLSESAAMDRVSELAESPPSLTRQDLAVARFLLESSIESNPSLAERLLSTLGKLTKAATEAEIKNGGLMDKQTLISLASHITECLATHFETCDSYDERLDAFLIDLNQIIQGEQECV